jgi:thioredoxin 1
MSKAKKFTDANFQREVLESDRPVLVDFWAAWCGPCRAVGPTIESLAVQYDGTVKVGKLNIDESPKAPSEFSIFSIPAVLLFKDGKVVEQFIGVQPRDRYETTLRRLAA